MTKPRTELVSTSDTPWYHCVSRCVRRAFLCGDDAQTGINFDHRRQWVEDRILELSTLFAIDVAGYAVMSNHYHVVLHIDEQRCQSWSDTEVAERWSRLFKGPLLLQRLLKEGESALSEAELDAIREQIAVYRQRLADLSWFMKSLNEFIARKANEEDQVKGHFWESRFKSQALLDESALLAALVYVDLNPIRAGLAETPEASDFTSVQKRIRGFSEPVMPVADPSENAPQEVNTGLLMPFDATGRVDWAIPFALDDYLALVDWTGRLVHPHKKGAIPEGIPEILGRLGFKGETFIRYAGRLLKEFGSAVGQPKPLADCCARRQTRYLRGSRLAKQLFETEKQAA
jgi:hypothetical protein